MAKDYKVLHVMVTDPGEKDWLYNVFIDPGNTKTKIFDKDFKSRSSASRAARKKADSVNHWYPF